MVFHCLPVPKRSSYPTRSSRRSPQLFEADGTPKYNSLVFTNHRLGYGYWSDNGATLNWMESALTDAEWYVNVLTIHALFYGHSRLLDLVYGKHNRAL
jgi:hypothetical protein